MNNDNVFEITDTTYEKEQQVISHFYHEVNEGKTVEGAPIAGVNVGGPRAFNCLLTNLPNYPSWQKIAVGDPIQVARYTTTFFRLKTHLKQVNRKIDFRANVIPNLMSRLLKMKLDFTGEQLCYIINELKDPFDRFSSSGLLLQQVKAFLTTNPLTPALLQVLQEWQSHLDPVLTNKLRWLIGQHQGGQIPVFEIVGQSFKGWGAFAVYEDMFALAVAEFLQHQHGDQAEHWHTLFFAANEWSDVSKLPKPQQVDLLLKKITPADFKAKIGEWLALVNQQEPMILAETARYEIGVLNSYSIEVLKGLLWIVLRVADSSIIQAIATLALNCCKTYDKEAVAEKLELGVPNADIHALPEHLAITCCKVLGEMPDKEALMQLTLLRHNINKPKTKTTIDKIIEQAAKKRGISKSELEDSAVPEL